MFKLRELIHSRRPAAAAALLLFTALLFYAGARMLPAIADETSWEDSKFGPLDGMEESVYSQTAAAYQDSFLSVARKQQLVIGYHDKDGDSNNFRALPINPSDFTGDAALEAVERGDRDGEQNVFMGSGDNFDWLLRAATAGVRPVSATIEAYNDAPQSYVFPSDVYMEVTGDYISDNHQHYLLYTYMSDDKTQQSKRLKLNMQNTTVAYGEWSGVFRRTPSGRPLDCTAADLNGDGYSELIVAYLTKDADLIAESGRNPGHLYIYVEMFDGKTLFDANSGDAVSYASRLNLYTTGDLYGHEDNFMPSQVRITKADFDSDGVMEFPVAFSSEKSQNLALVKYNKSSNSIEKAIDVKAIANLYNNPERYTTEGMDITVGDFDGNGSDEIMVVYGTYSGAVREHDSENRLKFACYKADADNGSFGEYFNAEDSSVNLWCAGGDYGHTSQVYAEAADFDGDGKDELVYTHPGWVDDGDHHGAYVSVRQWNNLDGTGTLLCNASTYDMFGWYFFDDGGDRQGGSHAMTVGYFKCTNDNAVKQVALASYGNDNKIDYAVIEPYADGEWKQEYKTHGYKSVTNARTKTLDSSVYTSKEGWLPQISLTAVDYDHQTMLLGEPSIYTMTAKIQPTFELQMAPRHYDVVNGASIDVFTKQVSMPMYGVYKTQADCTENDEVSSTETKSSETTMGVSVKASAKAGKEGGKVSGSASAGYSYTNTQKESNTQTNKYTATSSVSAAGMYDDFVSYQTEEIDVYRYPIIYPLDDDYGRDGSYAASDDVFGTDGDMTVYPSQRYLQIQVPQQPEQYAVSGLNAEWYDPVHQPYNLFTYPRELKEVKNYSSCVGETTKTNVVIGEANSLSVSVRLSEMTGETDTSSTTNKNSFNAELGVGIGQSNAAGKTPVSVSASFSYDETNSESSSFEQQPHEHCGIYAELARTEGIRRRLHAGRDGQGVLWGRTCDARGEHRQLRDGADDNGHKEDLLLKRLVSKRKLQRKSRPRAQPAAQAQLEHLHV
ncbi:hypothetical protein [Cloacibacillus evryensis]|uniref:hypothetical protein n=1 Tax=Cloacibacillus evryensis TaxID=508460 RepID=UPI002109357C|nr:hypothetical protein [Cloacibacillus evryensis]MCQ4764985.1 hypothetical protein [Cloacibacillus evryensis]